MILGKIVKTHICLSFLFPIRARVTLTSLINFGGKRMQSGSKERRFSSKYFSLKCNFGNASFNSAKKWQKSGCFYFFIPFWGLSSYRTFHKILFTRTWPEVLFTRNWEIIVICDTDLEYLIEIVEQN